MCKFKLVVLGDTSVGKSSIVSRFVKNDFFDFEEPTIGAAFLSSNMKIDNKNVNFEIWDTAGQERYRSLAPMYYRGAHVAIVVFDITKNDSFNGAKSWINELKNRARNCHIFLVANKIDLERKIEKNKIIEYATKINCDYKEVSAKSSEGINNLFKSIGKKMLKVNPDCNLNILVNDNNNKRNCCY